MSTYSISPRVNSARMKQFIGAAHPVRLPGKVLEFSKDDTYLVMEAADGGMVTVLLPPTPSPLCSDVTPPFVEIVGTVEDGETLKCMSCIYMGDHLDLAMVNQVIELSFDPQFYGRLF